MNIFQAIILGLIQGLTEFIPVSSSGHLVLLHHAFGIADHALAFDVALHGGTLIALLIYFWKDVKTLFWSLFKTSETTRLAHLLVLATLPAAALGYLLEDAAESTFRSPYLVVGTLIGFGLVMLLAEYAYSGQQRHTALKNVTLRQAVAMGFAQALALVPGVSRSGSTITIGLFAGLDRVAATRFSFLLGIPIMVGAVVRVFSEGAALQQVAADKGIFLIGVVTALLSGLLAIRFMLQYLSKHGLHMFAYYRIGLGLVALIALALG